MAMTQAQKQAIAKAKARLRIQQNREEGGFLPFVNKSIAKTMGAPVDVTNSIMGFFGAPVSDKPFGGSESIRDGMGKIGIPTPDRKPETVLENIGSVAGEAAAFMLPLGAAGKAASRVEQMANATRGAKSLPSNMLRAMNREMVNAPVRSGAIEAGGAVGAGTGRHIAEHNEMGPGGQMLTEVFGGIAGGASPVALKSAITRGPASMTASAVKGAVAPFTESGGFEIASRRIKELVQDPQKAVASIEDLKGANLRPSAASGEPGLMALEAAVLRDNPEMADDFAAQTSDAVQKLVGSIKKSGSVKTPQQFIRAKRDRLFNALDARIEKASQEATRALSQVESDVPPDQLSMLVRNRIESALADAKAQEALLWKAVPEDAIIPTKNLKAKYAQLMERLPKAQADDMPADAAAISEMGDSNVLMELDGLYKRLGEIGRAARAGDQFNRARLTDELRDAILEDMSNAPQSEIKEAIETARQFSRHIADRFRKGPMGKVLGYDRKGGAAVDEALTLQRTAGRPGVYGRLGVEAIQKATDYDVEALAGVQDYLKAQFTRAAVEDGAINPQKAQTWMRSNREALDMFPHLRDQFSTARSAEDVSRRVKSRAESLRRRFQRPEVSATARFLNAPVDQEVQSIMSAPDPGDTMKRLMSGAGKHKGAREGMKAGLSEWLVNNSMQGQSSFDDFGAPILSGAKMKLMLNSDRVRPALEVVFSKDEIANMERAADALQRVNRQKSAKAGTLEVTDHAPGAILSTVARVLGAKLGAQVSRNPGASIQAAQIGSSRMQKVLQSLTADKARQITVDAMRDPELMKALINHSAKMDRRAKMRHERVIRAWMGSVGARLLEDEEE